MSTSEGSVSNRVLNNLLVVSCEYLERKVGSSTGSPRNQLLNLAQSSTVRSCPTNAKIAQVCCIIEEQVVLQSTMHRIQLSNFRRSRRIGRTTIERYCFPT